MIIVKRRPRIVIRKKATVHGEDAHLETLHRLGFRKTGRVQEVFTSHTAEALERYPTAIGTRVGYYAGIIASTGWFLPPITIAEYYEKNPRPLSTQKWCNRPHREGRHEWYLKKGTQDQHCKACGFNWLAVPKIPDKKESKKRFVIRIPGKPKVHKIRIHRPG